MRFTYLRIRHFKSIEDMEIKDIENALILVGKNNTGKTSVLDAIRLLTGFRPFGERLCHLPVPSIRAGNGGLGMESKNIISTSKKCSQRFPISMQIGIWGFYRAICF